MYQTMRAELTKAQKKLLLAESEGAQAKADLAKVRRDGMLARKDVGCSG